MAYPTTYTGTYSSIITRPNATALIPVPVRDGIISGISQKSAFMALATKLPNMSSTTLTMPILASLPAAYFVTGEVGDGTAVDGLKATTKMAWANKIITAEEIAVIVPIPQNVLDDSSYDIWGQVKDKASEAFGVLIDNATIFDTNHPASWPHGIEEGAELAANTLVANSLGDLADDIGGPAGLMSLVEADGYDVTGFYGAMSVKASLRGVRSADGAFIFQPSMTAGTPGSLYGMPIEYGRSGYSTSETTLLIAGDWKQAMYAIRQDMTYKLLTEGVITDENGAIVYNLAQQDMVALRITMRMGWQLPNPINLMNTSADVGATVNTGTRYPFAILTTAA